MLSIHVTVVEGLGCFAYQRIVLCLCPSTIIERIILEANRSGSSPWTNLPCRRVEALRPICWTGTSIVSWRGSWFRGCIVNRNWHGKDYGAGALDTGGAGAASRASTASSHLGYPTGHRVVRMQGLDESDPLESARVYMCESTQ